MKIMLDTNVLARICHPTEFSAVQNWFRELLARGDAAPEFLISVLADYEFRRTLVDKTALDSLRRLDDLAETLRQVPVTSDAVRRAVELRHVIGGADLKSLSDADLLMAAQAQLEDAILATSDTSMHRIPGVDARDWQDIQPD